LGAQAAVDFQPMIPAMNIQLGIRRQNALVGKAIQPLHYCLVLVYDLVQTIDDHIYI
jgi:hypothetical protein